MSEEPDIVKTLRYEEKYGLLEIINDEKIIHNSSINENKNDISDFSHIHAEEIFERRNKAFRVLYDTVIEVEGAKDEKIFKILCKNLRRICNGKFAALAIFVQTD